MLASAFFAGAETGLISLNRVRLRHEVERKNRRAIILNGFVENSERLLGTTLFGTNLANVLVGVYASVLATRLFHIDNFWVEFGAAFVASGLLLVFGEIVPEVALPPLRAPAVHDHRRRAERDGLVVRPDGVVCGVCHADVRPSERRRRRRRRVSSSPARNSSIWRRKAKWAARSPPRNAR